MKELKKVMEAVIVTLGAVYKNDYRLIKQHCHELNIVGAFYYHFRRMFEKSFSRYRIDMEYSRMGTRNVSKEIHSLTGGEFCPICHAKHGRRIRSDFIIHKPGKDINLLAIEFKGEWSSGCQEWDERKLCELTKPLTSRPEGESYVCGYVLGVSIILKASGVGFQRFANGKREGNLIEISKRNLILKYKSYNRELVNKGKGDNV